MRCRHTRRLIRAAMCAAAMTAMWGCSGGQSAVGEPCDERDSCAAPLACVAFDAGRPTGVCLERCDPSATRVCADGSVCTTFTASSGVCNKVGGETKVGQACAASGECDVGAICLEDPSGKAPGYCWRACEPNNPVTCTLAQECKTYGEEGLSVCQERLLAGCTTGDVERRCAEGYSCGVSPDLRTVQEFTAFASRCTISGCAQDVDCPVGSVCRQFNGHYNPTMQTFSLPTTEAATQRYCYATCEAQDACGVLGLYTCLSEERCESSTNTALCKAFLDDTSLCVPAISSILRTP